MSRPRILRVDTFAERPFSGAPVTVCILESVGSSEWMQEVAREWLYKTVFVFQGAPQPHLRAFTATVEIGLSGSCAVAAAHALWETGKLAGENSVEFATQTGTIVVGLRDGMVEIVRPAVSETQIDRSQLELALGVPLEYAGASSSGICIAEIDSDQTLQGVRPDLDLIRLMPFHSVVLTSRSSVAGFDIGSRVFSPRIGIAEDPASTSAHCCLAPYWSKKLSKARLVCYEGLERRGVIRVILDENKVSLAGKAVTTVDASLTTAS
jgi:PhzF family phenazine biosynthesis protein